MNVWKTLPWIVAAVLLATTIVFAALYGNEISKAKGTSASPVRADSLIPVLESYYTDGIKGAAQYQGKIDNLNSKYFVERDFYTERSSKTLTLLEHFKTYQQTSDYTCGCGCAIMVLNYFGYTKLSERACAEQADTGTDLKLNTHGTVGTFPRDLAKVISNSGFNVVTNDIFKESGLPFEDSVSFGEWVRDSIAHNEPIIILSNDFGGHYTVIIGVDLAGAENGNAVLIVADPYDTTDHRQDGYGIWSLDRFYSMWKTPVTLITDDSQNTAFFIKVSKP